MSEYHMFCESQIKLSSDAFDSNAAAMIAVSCLCSSEQDIQMMLEQFIGHAEDQMVLNQLAEWAEAMARETRAYMEKKGIESEPWFEPWHIKNYGPEAGE